MSFNFSTLAGISLLIVAMAYGCKCCDSMGSWDNSTRHLWTQCLAKHTPAECAELKPREANP